VRAVGRVKRLAKRPPVLRRAASLVDCVLVIGGGDMGDFGVVVRRTDGLEDKSPLWGSRADMLLSTVSVCPL
jgi:hypothetical protein